MNAVLAWFNDALDAYYALIAWKDPVSAQKAAFAATAPTVFFTVRGGRARGVELWEESRVCVLPNQIFSNKKMR